MKRNERKMGGFANWEILEQVSNSIFFWFSCVVQVLKFWNFPQFPVIFRGPKKFSKHGFFHSVSGF